MWENFKKKVNATFKAAGTWLKTVFSGKGIDEANKRARNEYNSKVGSFIQRTGAMGGKLLDSGIDQGKALVSGVNEELRKEEKSEERINAARAKEKKRRAEQDKKRHEMQDKRRAKRGKYREAIRKKYGIPEPGIKNTRGL